MSLRCILQGKLVVDFNFHAATNSLEERIKDMDAMGVDIQCVGISVYQYYYWAEPEIGARVARVSNEELVEQTSKFGDRFAPLGTVPMQDTEAAIQELRYCVNELGMKGLEINSHVEGSEIADSRLDAFWAEVEKLGATPARDLDHAFRLAREHLAPGTEGWLMPHGSRFLPEPVAVR